jgi:molybdopterin synthase sulfur carrier subunit
MPGLHLMKIEYELFASFAGLKSDISGEKPGILDVAEGTTVDALVKQFHLPGDRPKMIFVNGRRANEDTVLKDGDRVGIFPLVAGG